MNIGVREKNFSHKFDHSLHIHLDLTDRDNLGGNDLVRTAVFDPNLLIETAILLGYTGCSDGDITGIRQYFDIVSLADDTDLTIAYGLSRLQIPLAPAADKRLYIIKAVTAHHDFVHKVEFEIFGTENTLFGYGFADGDKWTHHLNFYRDQKFPNRFALTA